MDESLMLPDTENRKEIYIALLPQIEVLVDSESDLVANMANVVAVLREAFGFFWVGFYRVTGRDLVLGPFQGSLACTRIGFGKGVCGVAWREGRSQLVPDVDLFEGHIACSSASRSEVVIPIFNEGGDVVGVLDIDSDKLDDFSNIDVEYLERLVKMIGNKIF